MDTGAGDGAGAGADVWMVSGRSRRRRVDAGGEVVVGDAGGETGKVRETVFEPPAATAEVADVGREEDGV